MPEFMFCRVDRNVCKFQVGSFREVVISGSWDSEVFFNDYKTVRIRTVAIIS